jgi:16S rRNA (guanine1516-N2)-methyltransferase
MKEKKAAEFHIDFLSKKMHYRREHAGLRSELVARAIGLRPQDSPFIVDSTAGLGRDSFILASLGFTVTMLERSSVIHQMLEDALLRAKEAVPDIVNRMHLVHADAIEWLKQLPLDQRPDVIYIDPMFPKRKKSASVKKDMVFMQELLGKDSDHATLFQMACDCAKYRVVVKRPRLAAKISERAANFCLNGKSSRFDIYLTRNGC